MCLDTASCLIMNCAFTKKVDNFINKMFKMADQYVTENNTMHGEKLTKVRITQTYESYRKKKEAIADKNTLR